MQGGEGREGRWGGTEEEYLCLTFSMGAVRGSFLRLAVQGDSRRQRVFVTAQLLRRLDRVDDCVLASGHSWKSTVEQSVRQGPAKHNIF